MLKNFILLMFLLALGALSFSKIALQKSWDLSSNKLNSLSQGSKKLLDNLEEPLLLEIYSPNMQIVNLCEPLVKMYAAYSSKVSIKLNNAIFDPKQHPEHTVVATYKNKQQTLDFKAGKLDEQKLSTFIQQTITAGKQWIVFLSGHEETDPFDATELGLNNFTTILGNNGMQIAQLNLAQQQQIPENTDTLLIVNPKTELLPIEEQALSDYLAKGGKLIWFTEPDATKNSFLQTQFGISLAPGVAIDPNSTALGSPHPALKIISSYPKQAITNDFNAATIMPWSGHLLIDDLTNGWQIEPFLTTDENSWTYTGDAADDIQHLSQHKAIHGPLNLGVAISRQNDTNGTEQRILVIADSSFIANKFLALYANAHLASNVIGWLQENTQHYVFSHPPANDLSYNPNNLTRFMNRIGFVFLLPILLISIGFFVRWRRTLAEPAI